MNITEGRVPSNIMTNIRGCAKDALKVLGKKYAKADPSTVVKAIDDFMYRWQRDDRPSEDIVEDGDTARLIMGSLWGEMLVEEFGWEWAKVTFHDYDDSVAFGVFSPDRSLAIYPLEFLLGCVQDPDVDVTVALSFNMLKAGKVPKLKKKSYTNLMDGVHRIVPRD
jgi:hypothetical protein